ncbi:MAG: BREX system P-loop protein BrxC, partial [Chloroflexota bacterium]|nr:BREX system P-loop protein BrxC [Chloroflexota bacterium]
MQIVDTFATHIQERIEPVVKVADRRPVLLLQELRNLIVTSQWEQYLRQLLDAWANASERADNIDPGIWISGFFGSGKSLLLKVLGVILEGGMLGGESVHGVFLDRLAPNSPDRSEIKRLLTAIDRRVTTSFVGGNLHALQSTSADSLALIAFKLFADQQGYTRNWAFAWAVEYYIDQAGKKAEFQQRAEALTGKDWEDLVNDTAFNITKLMQAAAETLPDHFTDGRESVAQAMSLTTQSGITPNDVIDRFVRWCRSRDGHGKRHRVLLQLDELGQWIAGGNSNERIMQVQALVETASVRGEGRVWIAVTAHGDVQALQANVQQEQYAKINQRFSIKCKLSNDDMSQVVEERLLRKHQAGRADLEARFETRTGELTDLGTLRGTRRVYLPPTKETFPLMYPFMPWVVKVIPDVVKGIAQAAGRGDALTGATRTMIAVVQGAILDTPGLLQAPVGRLLNLVDLYPQLVVDVPVETKTDLNSIQRSVPNATERTYEVAVALYLLGQASYIPCTLENVARALANRLDVNPGAIAAQIEPELTRLIEAGYAKQVGEEYVFLTTQQRSFQDKVRERQAELLTQSFELSQALRDYESEDVFRLHQIQILGRTLNLKQMLDGRVVQAGQSRVVVHILSPLQRALDPQIANDEALRQRSNQDQDTFFLRLAEAPSLRQHLALALATDDVANRVIAANPTSPEAEVARQAKLTDLGSHKAAVRKQLATAVRGGMIFFRGSSYHLAGGASPGDAARSVLGQLLPTVYSRLPEVQHRVANDEGAVRAALNGSTSNSDILSLGVLKADNTINESSPLLSAVRGVLPLENADRPPLEALELRRMFEDPPYGWDGNAVKVALALLLRSGACKLVIDGRP